jgi:hypothetical protein
MINGNDFRARVSDISAAPVGLPREAVALLAAERDAIMNAIDVVLYGYPVGVPRSSR